MTDVLKKILLIGSDPSALQLLATYCAPERLAANIAVTPEDANDRLHEKHYDLLVFDFDLRRKPFIDLVCEIDETLPYTPILLMTEDYQQSQQLIFGLGELDIKGSWNILEKPFQPQTFTCHVKDILSEETKKLHPLPISGQETKNERRRHLRKSQFQPIRFSFEQEPYGCRFKTVTRGFLTDVSHGGIGLLTNRILDDQQYLSFENSLLCGTGRVVWKTMVDEMTQKIGIRFC